MAVKLWVAGDIERGSLRGQMVTTTTTYQIRTKKRFPGRFITQFLQAARIVLIQPRIRQCISQKLRSPLVTSAATMNCQGANWNAGIKTGGTACTTNHNASSFGYQKYNGEQPRPEQECLHPASPTFSLISPCVCIRR
ncbi:uncharacterized protein ARMOST_02655 [Armillaria ostoyae]|uniref:Uncharacterized protein n=1 Tax=Armillaria ostoyae TaxID=47428 RepID=A0A284QSB0_ARMOS|nr:uncharacterized protein ARMOST_02655 [Armillaria ostoyae]